MTAFSPKQRTVLSWWVPGNPNRGKEAIVCDGAVRSGKTLAMGLSFFLWAMSCFSGQKFGVCGKTDRVSAEKCVVRDFAEAGSAGGDSGRKSGRITC